MTDPVVASDGHTYEREAIADVLRSANKKSPLTRAVLKPDLVPNHGPHSDRSADRTRRASLL